MPRATVPPDIKARAIADLMDGEQPAIVAERYRADGVTASQARKWKQRFVTPSVTESVTPSVTKPPIRRPAVELQQLEIGELIMANLRAKLVATQRIAEHVTIPTWLDKQGASDMATLFEALDRSAVGILDRLAQRSALTGGDDPNPPDVHAE